MAIYNHICEVCGFEALLTPEEAFDSGWDYPPRMGAFVVVSPRTCGNCEIQGTVWWALAIDKLSLEALNENQKRTIQRIMQEPASITIIK